MVKIVCEAGINHGGNFDVAMDMIKVAAFCEVDICKFQYYIPDNLCLVRNNFETSFYNTLERNKMRRSWLPLLKQECDKMGIEFASSVFCEYTAEDIAPFVSSFKVASPEVRNLKFIKKLATYRKPLILSTGKATQYDLDKIFEEVDADITLLYCVSKYPSLPEDYDLKVIEELKDRYKCPVGLSDHTATLDVSKEAIRMGVPMIERHFKISENCIDASVSLLPEQMKQLVRYARILEKLGEV